MTATPLSLPSATWRMLAAPPRSPKMLEGMDAAWEVIASWAVPLVPRRGTLLRRAGKVLALEPAFISLSDARLRDESRAMRDLFRMGKETPADLLRAFALVREVAARTLAMRPYLVQVAAGLAIDKGYLAELATGEGKTLSAALPATIAGWRGRGCHVITVNDYLAQRDAKTLEPVFTFCGLTVAAITGESKPPERRAAYLADITYLTNKEAAADHLRDQLALGVNRQLSQVLLRRLTRQSDPTDHIVMRGLTQAIIDEADSVLIDEAVTPLIISTASGDAQQQQAFMDAATLAGGLAENEHFRIEHRHREINLTPAGCEKLAQASESLGGIWRGQRRREELVTQALMVRHLYRNGQQYVIHEGKVVIVDESTGRLMPDRTWRDGMHQACEAREGLEVTPLKDTLARLSFQRFFRLYGKLGGMTGTAYEARHEIWRAYRMPTVRIPTNKPRVAVHQGDHTFVTASQKWDAVRQQIRSLYRGSQPILVGTRSVAASEHLSSLMTDSGMEHNVLNAVRHAEEAQIIAGAGQGGCVTVATNMAGRGTDIKLGRGVEEMGGLCVIATERHESSRVDRQLFGRAGRQGDPGSTVGFVSLEDELVTRHAPRWLVRLARLMARGEGQVPQPLARRLVKMAQARAQRQARYQRRMVLRADEHQRQSLGFAGKE